MADNMSDAASFEKISFFDEIAANKGQSLVLLFCMFALYLALIWIISETFGIGIFAVIIGLIVLVFYAIIGYFMGSSIILGISGARKVTREEYPYLYLTVEGLCAANAIKPPQIYIIEDPSPNAFVVGRNPNNSSLAVTRGLIEILDKDELTAVLAHEISHIANYDIRFMLFAVVFAGAIAMLSDAVLRGFLRSGSGRDRRGGMPVGPLILIAIVFMILAPIFAELIRFAISRKREYLADANGARMTRAPHNLASALEKIAKINKPVANATDTTAPLYFSRPRPNRFYHIFSTHPPTEERIKKLRAMA